MSDRPLISGDSWWWLLIVTVGAVQTATTLRLVTTTPRTELPTDVVMYLHYGWYTTQGGVPYLDFWDPKPPLVHETAAVMSTLTGGSPLGLYTLGVVLTGGAAVVTAAASGRLVAVRTDDPGAGLFAGVAVYAFAGFHAVAGFGYRPKLFAAACGIVGLLLLVTDRPTLGGAVSAAAAAFWQPGAIFPMLALAAAATRRRHLPRLVVGMGVATIVTVLPFLVWWDVSALIQATVVAPFVSSDELSLVRVLLRARRFLFVTGYASCIAVVGVCGLIWRLHTTWRTDWWLGLGVVWFGAQLLFLDFDGVGDVVLAVPWVAVVAGHWYAGLSETHRSHVGRATVGLLLVSAVTLGGVGVVFDPVAETTTVTVSEDPAVARLSAAAAATLGFDGATSGSSVSTATTADSTVPSPSTIYWDRRKPDRCFYWINKQSRTYIAQTGATIPQDQCRYETFSHPRETPPDRPTRRPA